VRGEGRGMECREGEGVISQLEQMQSNKIELCGDEQRVCGGLTYRRRYNIRCFSHRESSQRSQ